MAMMTVRNIPDEIHNALKARAKRHNRSAEAEMRAILEEAILPKTRIQMGDALAELGRNIGLTNDDLIALDQARTTTAAEPMEFE
jgi:plasmid stability protein